MLNASDDAFVKAALNEVLRDDMLKNLEYQRKSFIFLIAVMGALFLWDGERLTGLLLMSHVILLLHGHHTIILLKLLRSLNLSTGPLSHEDRLAMEKLVTEKRARRTQTVMVGILLIAMFVSVGIAIHQSMT